MSRVKAGARALACACPYIYCLLFAFHFNFKNIRISRPIFYEICVNEAHYCRGKFSCLFIIKGTNMGGLGTIVV